METKICKTCGEEKPLNEFHKYKQSKDGHRNICKHCRHIENVDNRENMKLYNIEYREKNKEKLQEYERLRSQDPKRKEQNKQYRENNIEKIRESDKIRARKRYENRKPYMDEYRKNRINNDPVFKLSLSVRRMIWNSLFYKNYTKKSRSYQILGCSFDEFKLHLESQFEPWMNWDNYGKYEIDNFNFGWDIDHIIPLSTATTEEDVIRLNHYTNLQPLCSKVNRDIKRNLINPLD